MFRGLFLFVIVATLALGLGAQTEALPSPNSTVAGHSAPDEPVAPLATEKKQLEQEICATSKAQNVTALDSDKGPKKVVVTEKKLEEFPENVTKEVTVTRKAEKGPSNETQENIVVERKTVHDIDSDSGNPKKNVTIEIESEDKVCDNTTEHVTKPTAEPVETNQSKHDLETEVEHLKHEEEKVKKELKKEEAKTGKVVPVNETEAVENKTKEEAKTEKVVPVNETEEVENKTKEEAKTGKVVPVNETEAVENKTKEEAKTGKVVPVNETEEVENKTNEQVSCDACRRELVMLKSINRKLLAALKKLLMKMTPEMREHTAKIILHEAAPPLESREKPVNATRAEAETPTAAKTKQEAVEAKPIIAKEATEA
ncbi:uncharacterized protein LOC135111495 [Scylla paramamosain]|uniref:uncharacterized protein LOC135111495 n=1 Tax=Scylla paramamosain TaxID=85552 RepID=UPI0030838DA4